MSGLLDDEELLRIRERWAEPRMYDDPRAELCKLLLDHIDALSEQHRAAVELAEATMRVTDAEAREAGR